VPPDQYESKLESDPLWFQDAVIYEVHVRAFHDSSGDGLGDFGGLSQKLDYLRDLGVTAVWVLPFCPSPWRDDGYDISDYTDVHPAYGSLKDFHGFLREAHRRGLRVITELVLNHTSDQHIWFQRARHSPPGSRWRDFYVWSNTPEKYKEARIIFKDTESSNWAWDPVAKQYYWHRFFSHQPDLNFDNPRVRRAVLDVVDFWFRMGVDGLRLDAVPYLYEREGTTCENLPETHQFLKELRRHIDSRFKDRLVLAEANQWPEDAIHYFGNGDESHMNFHFPLMPRLFMATRMEDRFPIVDILSQTPPIPEACQWAIFLRNHDELTLEMVTDEERDYMYRVYASDPQMRINLGIRRRLAPLLGNDRRRIELMNALLLSLPGTPVIYYGDEIGMGDNIYLGDRNGVRTPMQWSPDRNAGFSRANPQRLYLPVIIDPESHYEAINVESQLNNPASLLWWMKRIIALRKEYHAFGRGSMELLHPENRKVLAFLRRGADGTILVVANLSRFAQAAELDLAEFKGRAPLEMFGHSEFPAIGDQPYVVTLGPHAFYWFALTPIRAGTETIVEVPVEAAVPVLSIDSLDEVFGARSQAAIARILPAFLRTRRWFQGKARRIRAAQVIEDIPVAKSAHLLLVSVDYAEGDPETYLMPLALARGEQALRSAAEMPEAIFARVRDRAGGEGVLFGALRDRSFLRELLAAVVRRRRFAGKRGELTALPAPALRRVNLEELASLDPTPLRVDQANSSVAFGERLVLKLFRRLEPGVNPELETTYFLTEKVKFPHTPVFAGALEYRRDGEKVTIGVLHRYVPNQGNAWSYTLDSLSRYFEAALTRRAEGAEPDLGAPSVAMLEQEAPALAAELIGAYLESVRLIGRRLAELHLALASRPDDQVFAPEPFTDFYRQSLYHGMLGAMSQSLLALRQKLRSLPEPAQSEARKVLQLESEIRNRFVPIRDRRFTTMRIRTHGDFHLGELLYTGKDFVLIDLEGQTHRPISERRIKRSPLRDVASLLRSLHYASHAALYGAVPGVIARAEDRPALESWARFWNRWVAIACLKEYLATAGTAPFLPKTRENLSVLLYTFLLDKAITEVGYELAHRPEWVRIPLQGILQLVEVPWPA
jgi:maltose alpha-D-glucosyltransferase/alpha-amylase